jgi:inner membrane protein YidH
MTESLAHPESALINDDSSVELSSNRTSLSFERTRMATDRTLMSIVRTSLSLISFGFTIYQIFHQLAVKGTLPRGSVTANLLGIALIVMGLGLLVFGIRGHMRFGRQLNVRRERLYGLSLLHSDIRYTATPTLVVACLLALAAFATLVSISVQMAGS